MTVTPPTHPVPGNGGPPQSPGTGGAAGDQPEYVGYWEDLKAPPRRWRRGRTLLLVVALAVVFAAPLAIGGVWWLTMLISVVLVGTVLVLGAPPGDVVSGGGLFRRRPVLVAVAVAAVVLWAGFMAYDDVAFGTWSLSGPPPQVLACGTEFHATGARAPSPPSAGLHQVGVTPSGLTVLGTADCGSGPGIWVYVSSGGQLLTYRAACPGTCLGNPLAADGPRPPGPT